MIKGQFYRPQRPHSPYEEQPSICAGIGIGGGAESRRFRFLVDTGADITTLCVKDALALLGKAFFWEIQATETGSIKGYGGRSSLAHRLQGTVQLTHEGGDLDTLPVDVEHPSR